MKVIDTDLAGVKIIEPRVFGDERGFFFESFKQDNYRAVTGSELLFVQDNLSRSKQGVLRGLHYQLKNPQGKLVTVIHGEVFDVAVDVRYQSPTFGKWVGVVLSDKNHRQLYVPPGFAHGFCVLSESVDFHYKCTDYYNPLDEHGVLWSDSEIGINWPLQGAPILSGKDVTYKPLSEIDVEALPKYK